VGHQAYVPALETVSKVHANIDQTSFGEGVFNTHARHSSPARFAHPVNELFNTIPMQADT
jgi:hypothetical protein